MYKLTPYTLQYLCVIVVNLSVVSTGLGVAWSSPVLVKLQSNETEPVLGAPITDQESAWIASVVFLSGLICNFLVSFLLDKIGRKYSIIVAAVPKILAFAFKTFATKVWMVIVGRVFMGMALSFTYNCIPIYASEIASKEIRGSLGSLLQISSSIGVVMMLSIGPYLSYKDLNIMVLCISIATSIPLLFLPDTPYSSHKKGNTDKAIQTLIQLRGSKEKAMEEIKEYDSMNAESENNAVKLTEILKSRTVLKALFIVAMMNLLFQLTGDNIITYYLQTILESSKTSLSSDIGSVVIGCVQLAASAFAVIIIDRLGRKTIVISCLAASAVGLIALGTFFFVTEPDEAGNSTNITGFLTYLPLISLILTVFGNCAGFETLMWPMMSELFDGPARAVGMYVGTSVLYLTVFLITLFFPTIQTLISPAATYWSFAGMGVVLSIFVFTTVPETKGKSFAEIQQSLGGVKKEKIVI